MTANTALSLYPESMVLPRRMAPEDRLFRHTRRPVWGTGLWVREESTRRHLHFEDGKRRAFKRGFYHLLEPVDPDEEDLTGVVRALLESSKERDQQVAEAVPPKPAVMPFQAQVQAFLETYPQGFADPDYITTARRPTSGKPRRRHVDLTIAELQGLLDAPRSPEERLDGVLGALGRTRLVTRAKLRPLETATGAARISLAEAVQQLLVGEATMAERFRGWVAAVRALQPKPGWPLLTAPLALAWPDRHVCVRARVFDLQARAVATGERVSTTPSWRAYRAAWRISDAVAEALESQGLAPADTFDVRAFIWHTLRPKARKAYLERARAA